MPRRRNMIPRYITLDMQELDMIQASIPSDIALGAWFRSAVRDMRTGCSSPNTDIFIKEQYEISFKRMTNRQKIDNNYNRKSRQEAATRKDADLESFEKLDTSCQTFEDAPHREAGENLSHVGTTTHHASLELPTSSSPLQGAVHNTCTHPLSLGVTAAPCNNSADCSNDQVPVNERASSEAPLSASPDSGNGNVPDETAKSSFVAIVDDRSCKSGKSGDVAQAKRPYGEFRHVLLTDAEGAKLRDLYKEELKLAIDILDSYIENGGKAAKKYKSHALVMRKGNWVWQKVQETKLTEKRLENASKSRKSFAEQEMDTRTKFITTSVVPDDLTMEELEKLYG